MKKVATYVLVVLVGTASFAQVRVEAQKRQPKTPSKSATIEPSKPIVNKFSIASVLGEFLPADFNPMPIEELMTAVEKITLQKGSLSQLLTLKSVGQQHPESYWGMST